MQRVPGSKRLTDEIIKRAEKVERWRAEAVRCYDAGQPGAGLCYDLAVAVDAVQAFRASADLRDLGAFA